MVLAMADILRLIWGAIADFFRSRADLQTEIVVLRHQLNVLRRKRPERLAFGNTDRLLFVWLYRLAPGTLNALSIVRPETVIGWHRRGYRAFWRWKSRSRAGRPKAPPEVRILIREMSIANPLWGAPPEFTVNCSNSVSGSVRRPSPSTCTGREDPRPRDGRHFYGTTQKASSPWISSWFRPSRSSCSMDLW